MSISYLKMPDTVVLDEAKLYKYFWANFLSNHWKEDMVLH